MRIETHSARETRLLGRLFGEELRHSQFRGTQALVVALIGPLGSGKTTFTKGFAKGLGAKGRVASPTFILTRIHRVSGARFSRLVHMDAYRLSSAKELSPLGFRDILSNPKTILLVEWADIIRSALPKGTIFIKASHLSSEERRSFSFSSR